MKKYKVIVNGAEYEVAIEPMEAGEAPAPQGIVAPNPAAEARPAAQASPAAGVEAIKSPMPGNILSVAVQAGSHVKKGQVLMILEAMKMENEIYSPRDAVVESVDVHPGTAVHAGTPLCTLR